MLTDMTVEEEFEARRNVSWYGMEDVERDLHLAAKLGKTLLERNHELETGLRQMFSTNQDQLQEIEYLSRQVELLRQMGWQHTKVYEQLDATARELEHENRRLVVENRMAQHKIHGLTETIDGLQAHMKELQREFDRLKGSTLLGNTSRSSPPGSTATGQQGTRAPEVCCGTERPLECEADATSAEEENMALKDSLQALRDQLAVEEARREVAEQEVELTAQESGILGRRLAELEGCWERRQQLELQVEELRRLWRAELVNSRAQRHRLTSETAITPLPGEEPDAGAESGAESESGTSESKGLSDVRLLRSPSTEDLLQGHERLCARRSQALRQHGVCLLSEVDAQYSALQARYETLLHRCQQGADEQSHKAVQTARAHAHQCLSTCAKPEELGDAHPPEYRALFQEIFRCIRKTKEDLQENHRKQSPPQGLSSVDV